MSPKERVLEIFELNKTGKNDVLVICGPTCSGKSSLAMSLSDSLPIEIVSADSMQIYRGMDIGTAKPTSEDRANVPHHMIDIVDPWENYNAFLYAEAAKKAIGDVISRGKLPVVCGGTGLYINTLIENRDFSDDISADEFPFVENMTKEERYEKLMELDPKACATVHLNNEKRVKRFLLLTLKTGKTLEERNRDSKKNPSEFNFITVCLLPEREALYRKIDERVDKMFEDGLQKEAEKVYNIVAEQTKGEIDPMTLTALAAIGYRELLPVGTRTGDEARELIKLNTRHYAKRQLTWFRRTPGVNFVEI